MFKSIGHRKMKITIVTRHPGIVNNALLGFYHNYACFTELLTGKKTLNAPLLHINRYRLVILVGFESTEQDYKLFRTMKNTKQGEYSVLESFQIEETEEEENEN